MGRRLTLLREFLNAENGTLRQKAVRSTVWVGLSTAGVTSLSFIKSVILARLLIPDHFGLMAACMVVVRAVEVFTETGLGPALIQRRGDVTKALPTVYSLTATRGLLLAAIVVGLAPFVANFYEEPRLTSLLEVLAATLLLGGFSNVNSIVVQRELNFRPLFRLQQTVAITDFVVTIVLALWLRDVWALVLGQVIKTAVAVLLSFALLPGRPRFGLDTQIARELLAYGKFITGVTIVVYVTTEIDNVVIGKVLGMEALGIYVVAYMLANLPATHISKVVSGVMLPAYSKLQDDRNLLIRAYLQTTRVVSTVAIPLAVGIAVLADEIVTLVYGQAWREAGAILPILCVFGALRAVSSTNGYVFNAIGMPQVPFYINSAKLAIIAAVIVPLTREFDLIGAASAVTVPSVLMFVVSYAVFAKTLHVPISKVLAAVWPSLLASAAMGVVLLMVKRWVPLGVPGNLLGVVLGGVAFYLLVNRREMSASIRMIMNR